MMRFHFRVRSKYKIVAIIPKSEFGKNSRYRRMFHAEFDKDEYKKVAPKLFSLFRKMNGGKLSSKVVVELSGKPVDLKPIDRQMMEALKILGYSVDDDGYKIGIVGKDGKHISILGILKTKATKVRGYKSLKETYERTKNESIKKELEFFDKIIEMKVLDETSKIDVSKLSIYDSDKAKIVFTYNHRAIASQSTNVGWTSCMTFEGGIDWSNEGEPDTDEDGNMVGDGDEDGGGENYRHVGKGASLGVFIAYLVKEGDESEIKKPTARVLFKPYYGEHTGHVIWRCEGRVYGTAPSDFVKRAKAIVEKAEDEPKEDEYHLIGVWTDTLDAYIELLTDETKKLKESPELIHKIKNPSDAQLAIAVRADYALLKTLKNPSEAVQRAGIEVSRGHALEYIDNPSEDMQVYAIVSCEDSYRLKAIWKLIKDPSPKVQRTAANRFPEMTLELMPNPSEEVQRIAIAKDPLKFVPLLANPSEEIQLLVLNMAAPFRKNINIPLIKSLRAMTEKVKLLLVKKGYGLLQYVHKPISDEVRAAALDQDMSNIEFIDDPTPEEKAEVLKKYPRMLKHIKNPTVDDMKLAVESGETAALDNVSNIPDEVRKLAIEKNGCNIRHFKDAPEELKRAAIENDPESIGLIDDPSAELQELAVKLKPNSILRMKTKPTFKVQMAAIRNDPKIVQWGNSSGFWDKAVMHEALRLFPSHRVFNRLAYGRPENEREELKKIMEAGRTTESEADRNTRYTWEENESDEEERERRDRYRDD